jgi:hypothetical protein
MNKTFVGCKYEGWGLGALLPFANYNDEALYNYFWSNWKINSHYKKVQICEKLVNHLSHKIIVSKCDVKNNHELLKYYVMCINLMNFIYSHLLVVFLFNKLGNVILMWNMSLIGWFGIFICTNDCVVLHATKV